MAVKRRPARTRRKRTSNAIAVLRLWGGRLGAAMLAYVAVGGLPGLLIADVLPSLPACFPSLSASGAIEAHCQSGVLNAFWTMTVSIPRVLLILLATPIGLVKDAIVEGRLASLGNAIAYLPVALPEAALLVIGFVVWRERTPKAALLMLLAILVETALLAHAVK